MTASHMGVSIDPTTVKSGALKAAFDTITHPQTRGFGATVVTHAAKVGAYGTPTITSATPATTGGTLAAGSYSYTLSAITHVGETPRSVAVAATTTGTTSKVTLLWAASSGEVLGYKLYRGGLHLADIAHGVLTYVDTGAVSPSGAAPTTFPDLAAGEHEGGAAPKPADAGAGGQVGEGDAASPTQAGL